MKAVVLAAGQGTRLGPFTHLEPKVMIPVANRPILEYVVKALVENGVRDIVLVIGYRKERIMTHFEEGRNFGARIEYVVQDKQLGTAHAVLQAQDLLEDDFLVLPGDNVIDAVTVRDLLKDTSVPSIVITESDIPSKYGVVTLKGESVTSIVEKPEEMISNLINTGIYALNEDFLKRCREHIKRGIYDIPRVLEGLAREGNLRAITTQGTWIDVVYPWDLIKVNATALAALEEGIAGKVEEGVVLRGPVSIGEGSVVRAGSYIQGPVVIGEGCDIGPHVTIHPSTSIGKNVTIGASSVLEESLLMNDCSIGPFGYVSHSVFGKGVRAGSHFSAFSGEGSAQVEGEWHDLQLVGAFLGEDTVVGSGVRAIPGAIVGARCRAGPGTILRGTIPPGTSVL